MSDSPVLDPVVTMQILCFVGLCVLVLLLHRRRGGGSVGLVFIYLLNLSLIHVVASVVRLFDTQGPPIEDQTIRGGWIACLGLVGFVAAAGLQALLGANTRQRRAEIHGPRQVSYRECRKIALAFLLAGIVFRLLSFSPVARIPSAISILSAAGATLEASLGLLLFLAFVNRDSRRFFGWLGVSALLPASTVLGQGFLGYGTVALMAVLGVVTSIYRPRWKLILAWVVLIYMGLSVYSTYMRSRDFIRETVWGGAPLTTRLSVVADVIVDFDFFILGDTEQARLFDLRLNQNILIGHAADNLDAGRVSYAKGESIVELVLALIPRAVWPDKPFVGGSGDIVAQYTGMVFSETTSIGVGHVMEFYVNFGNTAVVAGFFLLGSLLLIVDRRAGSALREFDFVTYMKWFVPGVSLLQVGGSLREMTISVLAAWIGVLFVVAAMRRLGLRVRPRTLATSVHSVGPTLRVGPKSGRDSQAASADHSRLDPA